MKTEKKRNCADRIHLSELRRRRKPKLTGVNWLLLILAWCKDAVQSTISVASVADALTDRERGEGGVLPGLTMPNRSRYRSQPTYHRLVSDLRREASRAEAEDMLRRRVPPEALPWLNRVLADDDMITLSAVSRSGVDDDVVEKRILQETLSWIRRLEKEQEDADRLKHKKKKLKPGTTIKL